MNDSATKRDVVVVPFSTPQSNSTSYFDVVVDKTKIAKATSDNTTTKISITDPNLTARGKASANAVPAAIAENWNRIWVSEISDKLYSRLLRFGTRPDGWRGHGSKSLSPSAVTAFLEFWIKVREKAVEPQIALTAKGGIQAQWYKSRYEYLDLSFQPDKRVFFGLFRKGAVFEGVVNLEEIVPFLESNSAESLTWKER